MRITTLGTSHGDHTYRRFNSSTLFETDGHSYLVDSGEPVNGLTIRPGKPGRKARGLRITAGSETLTDAAVAATAVVDATVTVTMSEDPPAEFRLWYGSGADGQGKAVLRDAASGIPVPMRFGVSE